MYKDDKKLYDYPRSFWEDAIRQWVRDEQARYCLLRNFLDNIPYEQIAEELNISRATVYNKVAKYSPILFEHIS